MIDGVVNAPTTGTNTISVDTTSDTAGSNTFSIVGAQPLSVTSITDTPPSAAAGAKSIYTVGFTTSSTGGLSNAAGSQILITFPANTDLTGPGRLLSSRHQREQLPRSATASDRPRRSSPAPCSVANDRTKPHGQRRDRRRRQRTDDRDQHDQRRHHLRHRRLQHLLDRRRTADQPADAAAQQHCCRRGECRIYDCVYDFLDGRPVQLAGSQITITFPATTDLTHLTGSSVADTNVSNSSIGNCFRSAATVVTCGLFSGQSISTESRGQNRRKRCH